MYCDRAYLLVGRFQRHSQTCESEGDKDAEGIGYGIEWREAEGIEGVGNGEGFPPPQLTSQMGESRKLTQ